MIWSAETGLTNGLLISSRRDMLEPMASQVGREKLKGLGRGSLKNAKSRKSISLLERHTPYLFEIVCGLKDRHATFMW